MWWNCESVYCGFWVNESNSPSFRATLTLPSHSSYILVGFFAIFVKFSGSYLWGLILFAIHQINASEKPQDDLYHQTQLLLRNTESESTFVESLLKVIWAHKGSRFEACRRSVVLLLIASTYGIGLTIVGGISSNFITAGDESVLSVSKNCGWIEEPDLSDAAAALVDDQVYETSNALAVMGRNSYRRSASYSRSCYGRFGGNSTTCRSYVKTTLPYSTSRGIACPFQEKACNGTAISFDTGYIRTDADLGINTSPADSLAFRKVLTCVPLAGERYTTGWQPIPAELLSLVGQPPGSRFQAYEFGSTEPDLPPPLNNKNYTRLVIETEWNNSGLPYDLRWATANVDLPPTQIWFPFSPIPDMRNTSGDTTLIGLSNHREFRTPVTDPWFTADSCTTNPSAMAPTTCKARNPLSFLGCQEQYQFCKVPQSPSSSSSYENFCTPLTGLYALTPDILFTKNSHWNGTILSGLTPLQNALYKLLGRIISSGQIHFQLGFIGRENLVAQEYLWDGGFELLFSAPLPSNHWENEVMNWMNVTLAMFQRAAATFSRPTEVDIGGGASNFQHITLPQSPDLRSLCGKIKIKSAEHTSYSVTAMAIVTAVGFICILSNHFVQKFVLYIQRRTGHGKYKRSEWSSSSAFQLQRMAAEGKGIGPWKGTDKDIPTIAEFAYHFRLADESPAGDSSRYSSAVESGAKAQYRVLTVDAERRDEEGYELYPVMEARDRVGTGSSTARLL